MVGAEQAARRRWTISGVEGAAGLVALSIRVSDAGPAADALELVDIRVGRTGEGRLWRGDLLNQSDQTCTGVVAELAFLDAQGRPVGALPARAARLAPGARLELAAAPPPEAAAVQVRALRWSWGRAVFAAGPGAPASFDPGG